MGGSGTRYMEMKGLIAQECELKNQAPSEVLWFHLYLWASIFLNL